jgi:hypothetical protein
LSFRKGEEMNKIMVLIGGSSAIHKLGDIGRDCDDYIRIHDETEDYYIGSFEEGYGFINVQFRKKNCRLLTEAEIKELNGKWYGINGCPLYRIYVDSEGNVINGTTIIKKGIIYKVIDSEGNDKHSDFVGLKVEFPSDIDIGRSLQMIADNGVITTSKVMDVKIEVNKNYIISTKNSIYYIEIQK